MFLSHQISDEFEVHINNLGKRGGGLIDKVHVDIMWVVAKMSMSVHVRGVGGQKWVKSCPRGY